MSIEAMNVSKRFADFCALDQVSLKVNSGELVALLGPSGCGKTTLLRVIAGLESLDEGKLLFNGENITDRGVRERKIGFVFQHYALFRNMNVYENIAFGLKVKTRKERRPKEEIDRQVKQLLDLVQMEKFANHFPVQLSGGQRQRVALARALAVTPQVLLLDEPFAALDTKVRKELRLWLRNLHDQLHITSVFVTHDQEEAMEVADRVIIMNEGRVEQVGTPAEIYNNPVNAFVYQFFGDANQFDFTICDDRAEIGCQRFPVGGYPDGSKITGFVRPFEIEVYPEKADATLSETVIRRIQTIGPVVRVELESINPAKTIVAELTKENFQDLGLATGNKAYFGIRKIKFFEI